MSLTCVRCNTVFKSQSSLNRHIRNIHKVKLKCKAVAYFKNKTIWSYKCLEEGCTLKVSFRQHKGLVEHLCAEHKLEIEFVDCTVADMNEFNTWKKQIEKDNKSSYTLKAHLKTKAGITTYYNCDRSGCNKYRKLSKSKGSFKMGSSCTSQIKLLQKDDGTLSINWCKTHYGHDGTDLQNIEIPKDDPNIGISKDDPNIEIQNDDHIRVDNKLSKVSKISVTCERCNNVFKTRANLNRHLRNIHKVNSKAVAYNKNETIWSYKCLEEGCNDAFGRNKLLIEHLCTEHKLEIEFADYSVANMNEFIMWKKQIEKDTKSSYTLKSNLKRKQGIMTYYNCNRSGSKSRANSEYKRRLKSQASCKIGSSCTSQIKLLQKDDGTLSINWCKTHYGHGVDLQHIRIPKDDRHIIASKLINGVTAAKIIESVRDNILTQPERVNLITFSDINNIKAAFKIDISDGKKHPNQVVPIDQYVEECKSTEPDDNPVLFYKKQGDVHNQFLENDFCLIVMNKSQEVMLEQFGSNIIAVDGSHDLEGYSFELTTLMVIDEFKEGFPVAFMFANRKDSFIYNLFFDTIKSFVGILAPTTFMADLYDTFYNAWCQVMGAVPNYLFCSWYVDRTWQSDLYKISDVEKRDHASKLIKTLQQETNASNFETRFQSTINTLLYDADTEVFGNYFKNMYGHNFQKWAYCYREVLGINNLESMHNVIKYFHLERKSVRRVDKGLHVVMQYVRDKSVERFIKLSKDKNTKTSKTDRLRNLVTSTFYKIQELDFDQLGDDIIEQMYYHLNIMKHLTSLPKSGNINTIDKPENQSNNKTDDPQL